MAQRVNVVLVDDLDDSEADETVSFALDGTSYEIDLSAANAAKLRDALALYIGHGRRAGGGRRRSSSSGRSSGSGRGRSGSEVSEMRAWGRANGFKVSERGRVSAELREAYAAAH